MTPPLQTFLAHVRQAKEFPATCSSGERIARQLATILLDIQPLLSRFTQEERAGMAECIRLGGSDEITKLLEEAL